MKKIGIIVAMDVELDAIRAAMTEVTTVTISGVNFYDGMIGEQAIVCAKSGIGKVFAAICAEAMILRFAPSAVICAGVAGYLSDKLPVGGIVIADQCCEHDMDTSPIGDPVGLLSGINMIFLPADERLVKLIRRSAEEIRVAYEVGTVASGDQFISSSEKQQWIRQHFSAVACEMEGASIGHVCYVNRIPFSIIRAISDNGNDDAGADYSSNLAKAAAASSATVLQFVRNFAEF